MINWGEYLDPFWPLPGGYPGAKNRGFCKVQKVAPLEQVRAKRGVFLTLFWGVFWGVFWPFFRCFGTLFLVIFWWFLMYKVVKMVHEAFSSVFYVYKWWKSVFFCVFCWHFWYFYEFLVFLVIFGKTSENRVFGLFWRFLSFLGGLKTVFFGGSSGNQ